MAYVKVFDNPQYFGLSGDTKPTSGVTVGSFLFELDTDTKYIWDGSAWQAQSTLGSVTANPAAGTLAASTAYEASKVIKPSPGTLIGLFGYNSKGSAQFIQIHNAAAVPGDGAAPVITFTVPASSNFSLDVPITGIPLTVGISVCNSSTGPTKTIGSADVWFNAVYI